MKTRYPRKTTCSTILFVPALLITGLFISLACTAKDTPPTKRQPANVRIRQQLKKSTQEVREEFIAAFNAREMDRLLKLYADEAVIMPDKRQACQGEADIRRLFRDAFNHKITFHNHTRTSSTMYLSGDLIFEVGTYTMSMTIPDIPQLLTDFQKGITIWERQPDGSLTFKIDIWCPDKMPEAIHRAPDKKAPHVLRISEGKTSGAEKMKSHFDTIKTLEETFHQIFLTDNPEAAIEYYARDAWHLVEGQTLNRGRNEIRTALQKIENLALTDIKRTRIKMGGNDKMVYVANNFTWVFKQQDPDQNNTTGVNGNGLHVWIRQDGDSWKLLLDCFNLNEGN